MSSSSGTVVFESKSEARAGTQMVGKEVKPRKDLPLVQGLGTYVGDIKLPKMVYAFFVRSVYAHARIKNVDTAKALAVPGVVYVLTGKEETRQLVSWMSLPGQRQPERLSLARDKVRYVGEPVAVVAATSLSIAEDAAELVEVEYEFLDPVVDAEKALEAGSPLLYEDWKDNVIFHDVLRSNGTEKAFEEADFVFRERLVSNRYSPTPMENRGVLASYDDDAEFLTIWASTQFPHVMRTFLSQVLEFPENKIRVIAPNVGGGFGIKSAIFPDEVSVVILSMKLGRPVKWVEERHEHLLVAGHERQQVHYVECAVKKDGTLLGVKDRIIADFGASGMFWTEVQPAMLSAAAVPGPYRLRNYDFDLWCVSTNKAPCGPHRGFGRPVAAYVIERMMDIIARKLKLSPVEIRLKNLIDPSEMPWTTPVGVFYDSGNYRQVLERTLSLADYDGLRRDQSTQRKRGKLIGLGLATYVEYTAPGSSRLQGPLGWAVGGWESCHLMVDPTGKVTAQLGTASQGQAHETIFAQVISDALGAKFEDVYVGEGDTQSAPYGWGAWASRSTVASGGACIKASRKMKDKILHISAHLLDEASDDLEMTDSVISSKKSGKTLTLQRVADVALRFSGQLPEGMEPGLDVVSYYEPESPTTCSYATHLAMVEVDPETGSLKLLKYFIVDDAGVLVNPLTVEGQVHGALAHGIGGALLEDLVYSDDGQLLSSTFVDYLLPTAEIMPEVIQDFVETPSLNLGGFKGMGEGAAIPTAAALTNAIDDALSDSKVKFLELPITPEKVYRLIKGDSVVVAK
ncbi:MAG TPA: xanthine dehydrogenase family protein molybdopterin-binding subunit [Nitrososphaerales archaeon]|nr:xanthine dehydrogenase family protein molybdopterin-binding subunit [Nitrososphaerales archaeon]